MRKNIVAGNWKMNTTLAEGLALAKGLDEALKGKTPNCDVIIGTPFTLGKRCCRYRYKQDRCCR